MRCKPGVFNLNIPSAYQYSFPIADHKLKIMGMLTTILTINTQINTYYTTNKLDKIILLLQFRLLETLVGFRNRNRPYLIHCTLWSKCIELSEYLILFNDFSLFDNRKNKWATKNYNWALIFISEDRRVKIYLAFLNTGHQYILSNKNKFGDRCSFFLKN